MSLRTLYATGAGALAATIAPGVAFQIEEIRVHLGSASATSENITVTLDHAEGAAYDVVLKAQDMNAVVDFVWIPARPAIIPTGSEVDIAWANTNTETFGLEVLYKGI